MESSFFPNVVTKDERGLGDNIFAHAHNDGELENENVDDAQQQRTTNDDLLPQEHQLFHPDLFGTIPSSSPTGSEKWNPQASSSTSTSTVSQNRYSEETLSAIFSPSCPSLLFLSASDKLVANQETNLREASTTSHSTQLVASLERILPFRGDKDHWKEGRATTTMYAVEALLTWSVVSLVLGLWFLLLVLLRKTSRRSGSRGEMPSDRNSPMASNSKDPPTQLLRPSFEQLAERELYTPSGDIAAGDASHRSLVTKNNLDVEENAGRKTIDIVASDGYLNMSQALNRSTPTHFSQPMSSSDSIYTSGSSNFKAGNHETHKTNPLFESETTNLGQSSGNGNCNDRNPKTEENNGSVNRDEDPCFIPVLPIMSDLSMPPGISRSSSSFTSDGVGEGVTDEDSLGVLASDDIYTGNAPSSTAIKSPIIDYLSYCLEDTDCKAISSRQERKTQHRNYSRETDGDGHYSGEPNEDISLLISIRSTSSLSRTNVYQDGKLKPNQTEESKTKHDPSPCYLSTRQIQNDVMAKTRQNRPPTISGDIDTGEGKNRSTALHLRRRNGIGDSSSSNRGHTNVRVEGHIDADPVYGEHGAYLHMGDEENKNDEKKRVIETTACHPSLKDFVVGGASVTHEQNHVMLSFCDDSNTTINLLADSDSFESVSIHNESFEQDGDHPSKAKSASEGKQFFDSQSTEKNFMSSFTSDFKLRFSRYTSDALTRKRQLEAYLTTRKKANGNVDKEETVGSTLSVTKIPQDLHETNKKNDLWQSNSSSHQGGSEFIQPVTEDLEALFVKAELDSTSTSLLRESDAKESTSIHDSDLRGWLIGKESVFLRILKSLLGRKTAVALSCAFLIASVVLFTVMGFAELQSCQDRVDSQFESLVAKATSPFDAIDEDNLDWFMGELDRKTQNLYQNLDEHCPKIPPSLCDFSDSDASPSSSCNHERFPLWNAWLELLDATGKSSPSTPSLLIHNGRASGLSEINPYDPLFHWFITAKDDASMFVSHKRNYLRKKLTYWKWTISLAFTTSAIFAFISVGILFAIVQPIAEKYFKDNRQKRNSYNKIGSHQIESSTLDVNHLFSLFTRRVFAIIFWSLMVGCWLIGLAFTVAMVKAVNICSSEEPNALIWKQLDEWEETISHFGVENASITELWKQQLRHCESSSISRESNEPIVSPVVLESRIDSLSHLAGPIQTLTEELQNSSTLATYEDICGGDIQSVLQATEDVSSQMCIDAETLANAYLEITSCGPSSWLSLYHVILNDTVCDRGLKGITWATGTQISILFLALVVWTFRSVFLVSLERNPVFMASN